jgi:hypothetical protein
VSNVVPPAATNASQIASTRRAAGTLETPSATADADRPPIRTACTARFSHALSA